MYSPGWDASPSQINPQHFCQVALTIRWYPFMLMYMQVPKNTTQCPQPVLEPGPLDLESNALTIIRTPRLPHPSFNLCMTVSRRHVFSVLPH